MSLLPQVIDFNAVWPDLKLVVVSVLTARPITPVKWVETFSDVYSLCVAQPDSHACHLYRSLVAVLEDHVTDVATHLQALSDTQLVAEYVRVWDSFRTSVTHLDCLFDYLNVKHLTRARVSEVSCCLPIGEDLPEYPMDGHSQAVGVTAYDTWSRSVLCASIRQRLLHLCVPLVDSVRAAETGGGGAEEQTCDTARTQLAAFISALIELSADIYNDVLGTPLLEHYDRVFGAEAASLYSEYADRQHSSVISYVRETLTRLRSEQLVCASYLSSQHPVSAETAASCLARMRARYVTNHLGWLMERLKADLSGEYPCPFQLDSLAHVYTLLTPLKPCPSLEQLSVLLESHIKRQESAGVLAAAEEERNAERFTHTLARVHCTYTSLVAQHLADDPLFFSAVSRACSHLVNLSERAPQLLVCYCDTHLRRKHLSSHSAGIAAPQQYFQQHLECVFVIFRLLHDKDVFQSIYHRFLCKRLIFDRSLSHEMEELMIGRFGQLYGHDEFCSRLTQMMKDMSISHELSCKFEQIDGVMQVKVLQLGAWPLQLPAPSGGAQTLVVPHSLELNVQLFEAFYMKQFNGRKLTWCYQLTTLDVRLLYCSAYAGGTVVTMHVQTFVVLSALQYSDAGVCVRDIDTALSPSQLCTNVRILVEADILCTVQSLGEDEEGSEAAGEGGDMGDLVWMQRRVRLNLDYRPRRSRVKLAPPCPGVMYLAAQEDPVSVDRCERQTVMDRKVCLQACVVRLMKTYKRLSHAELVRHTVQAMSNRFIPQTQLIKWCLDVLVEKGYLCHSNDECNEYSYVA